MRARCLAWQRLHGDGIQRLHVLDEIGQVCRRREDDGVVPAEQFAGFTTVRVTYTDDGNHFAARAFFVVACHLEHVRLELKGVIAADELQRIVGLPVEQERCQRLRYIIAVVCEPVGMAEHGQTTASTDFVETPHARGVSVGSHIRRKIDEGVGDGLNFAPVRLVFESFVDAEASAKVDDVCGIVRRVDLLTGIEAQVDGDAIEGTDGFQ